VNKIEQVLTMTDKKDECNGSCVILVLGDIGRSPRMQYHCLALTRNGFNVDFVGYMRSSLLEGVEKNERVNIHPIKPWRSEALPFALEAPIRVIVEMLQLFWVLFSVPSPIAILVQNPPSIPSLFVARIVSWARGSAFVIDWHNLGYSLLQIKRSDRDIFVWVYKFIEIVCGCLANSGFAVTGAMAGYLQSNYRIPTRILYDKPRSVANITTLAEYHGFFTRLQDEKLVPGESLLVVKEWEDNERVCDVSTLFSLTRNGGKIELNPAAPLLLISSTSWTPDEDFSVLLKSLPKINKELEKMNRRMIIVITGKDEGSLKKEFFEAVAEMNLTFIRVKSLFLSHADYLTLLSAADIGLCFHTSSSGLDLPMKVVDMFSAGLPVLAVHFPTLTDELVIEGKTGLTFKDSDDFLAKLSRMINDATMRQKMRDSIIEWSTNTWDKHWDDQALPLFKACKQRKKLRAVFSCFCVLSVLSAVWGTLSIAYLYSD